jgi:hypothetical protein
VTGTPQQSDSVTFTVVAPESVHRGEPVSVTLRLTNTGDRAVTLYLTGRSITFDIIVAKPDGEVVWRRLEHLASQQILQVKSLAPGEILHLKDTWRAAVAPGDYTVTGVIPTDREPLRTAPARLRITP